MARGYSDDLRLRVILFVERGEAAREAARHSHSPCSARSC
jgi:hypothetical protein